MKLNPRQLGVEAISSIVKILGVHFTYQKIRRILSLSKNFERILERVGLERPFLNRKDPNK